ncbi:hexosyltransferase [candidate division KSB3 bacterium]|uniref:Hexosyltransferase n=1 Tax=candidate division KSB3 bacterium TaxID=2044937 RepID=A0A2G6E294_9BACT|nr:MAG: hexosyltransferase [candidate division KSB3 bacterium]PIE28626.1 MAG: hexosyltransferase [candidate division KSB3 bacterium]
MRVAFVVQRYGLEVNGGAEALCRWVAERMQRYFELEVLTTCALDYLSWENHFPDGLESVNGVKVRRFSVDLPRNMSRFNRFARKLFARRDRSLLDELAWVKMQGPSSAALLAYIKEHEAEYDLFIFVTYSYLTTFLGLQLVPHKSILIPAAHDEAHFQFSVFQPIFHLPRGMIFSTQEERRLVHTRWRNERIPSCIAGVGLEESEEDSEAACSFPSPYLLYVGRIDVMKGCQKLLDDFLRYCGQRQPELHLVLLGRQEMDCPDHERIHAPGFVSEACKADAVRRATLVVNPSEFESLSLLILEAWQAGVPVLVNGRSEVLTAHCLKSNGGLYYTNYEEFALCLDLLLGNRDLRQMMGRQGRQYVDEHYCPDRVEKSYVDFITRIANA